ncbi:hypothetical protein BDW62DRAFT_215858 [Aspergillus aurantiobrunneus]
MESTGSDTISQSALYTAIWVEYGICSIVMILRAYSQLFVLRSFAADDFVMLGAYVVQGIGSVLCTVSASWGLGGRVADLSYNEMVNLLKYAMIAMPFGIIAPFLGRISCILFLLSSVITVHKLRRKMLWALIALSIPINVLLCILQFTQCTPASSLWDPQRVFEDCQSAVVVSRYGYFAGAFNALSDLILTVTGLAVVLTLNTHRSDKIILSSILSLSLLAMVAAILKALQLDTMNTPEFSYPMGLWVIWYLTEGTVVIITASVPRLRAIFVLGKQGKSSYSPYISPDVSNGNGPTYEDRLSGKHRSVRLTYLDPTLQDTVVGSELGSSGNRSLEAMPVEQATKMIPTSRGAV